MESVTTKDFLEKLNSGNLKPASKLMGFVKKSEKKSEVLFAFKHDLSNWIIIPESMIESVIVLKNIPDQENALTLVKLHLKMPPGGEAKTLYDLLAALSEKVNKYQKIKWMKKMLFGEGMHGCSMHRDWTHSGTENKCNLMAKEHGCSHHHE